MPFFHRSLPVLTLILLSVIAVLTPATAHAQPVVTPENLVWVRTGGPLGGLGYDVRMHPEDPDMMYVTDAFAGVFRSTDGGATWTPINNGITTRVGESGDAVPVFSLTIDPNNPDTLWIGTQGVRGIYKSINGGESWVQKVNGITENQGLTFRAFTVEPGNSNVVYAAAEISSWAWNNGVEQWGIEFDRTKGVVYKTIDAGENWDVVWRGDNLARYIVIDPRNTEIIFVSTGIFDREAANSDPDLRVAGGVGILKSLDGGQTWSQINNGLGNLYISSLIMHPQNPDILLAGAGNIQYRQGGGVYRTTDGGESWQQKYSGNIIQSVEFSTSNPEIAYAGNSGSILRSENGGQNWSTMVGLFGSGWGPQGIRAGFPIDFQPDPRNPSRIFANSYGGGNFLSMDGGKTWSAASKGYTGALTRCVKVDPTTPGIVWVASRSGLFASSSGGNEWIGLSTAPTSALEWQTVAIDPNNQDRILAANYWNKMIWQSDDRGSSWKATNFPISNDLFIRTIEFAPSNSSIVYAGSSSFIPAITGGSADAAKGILVSQNGGASWSDANDSVSADAHVVALAISSSDSNVVFAATGNHGVLKTLDGGQSWTSINTGLPSSAMALSVAIHPSDENILLVGIESGGVYRSTDGGTQWQMSSSGMAPEASVSSIVYDPTNSEIVYAADRVTGVYRSEDGGAVWQEVTTGLRTRAINSLAITMDGQHLYAASEGEGVFRLDISGTPPATTEWPQTTTTNGTGGSVASACGVGTLAAMIIIFPMLLVMGYRRWTSQ